MTQQRADQNPQAVKRLRIIDAALAVFAREGLHAARIDQIAVAAGIAKGTVYLYFSSKEQLFEDAIKERLVPAVGELARISDDVSQPADEALLMQLRQIYTGLFGEHLRVIVRLIIAEGTRFPGLIEFYHQTVVSAGLRALHATLQRGVDEGVFAPRALADLPKVVMGPALLAGIWKQLFDHIEPLDIERMAEAHHRLLVEGLRPRAG